MRHRAAALIVVLALTGCAGSDRDDPAAEATQAIVSLGEIPTVAVRPGGSATLIVPVVVAEGYKVQANPAADEFLVPLELFLEPDPALTLARPEYPPPGRHRLVGADTDLLTYEDAVRISVPVTAAASAPAGPARIRGRLRYQACDAKRCYFPATIALELGVEISGYPEGIGSEATPGR